MRRSTTAIGAAVFVAMSLVFSVVAPASADAGADAAAAKTAAIPLRGVSVAGGEFANTVVPTFDTAKSYAYLASRHYTVVRLPFLWESVQPTLGGPLDPATITRIENAVTDAAASGLKVILDVHNYGRYDGIAYGEAGSFTEADFVDLWTRISTEFRDEPAVMGYGLMNEPHDLPTVDGVAGTLRWQQAQQAALDGIRANDDVTCVLVSGYSWSSMAGWLNPANEQEEPYITDPADNFRWEAHDYWDIDSNGGFEETYDEVRAAAALEGYPAEPKGDALRTRVYSVLAQWLNWLDENDQKGYIGEFGWPSIENAEHPADAAAWNDLAAMYLAQVNETPDDLVWTTAWATGAAWPNSYDLLYYTSTYGQIATPLSNAAVLEANATELNPNAPAAPPFPTAPVVPTPPVDQTPTASPSPSTDPTPPVISVPVTPAVPEVPAPTATAPPAATTPTNTVTTKKSSSTVRVVAKNGRHPKLTIKVRSSKRVTGVVTVTLGKRVLAKKVKLKNGVAVITITKKLPAGSHKLVVRYAGTKTIAASTDRVKVRVAR
jgi:hypothetical protein